VCLSQTAVGVTRVAPAVAGTRPVGGTADASAAAASSVAGGTCGPRRQWRHARRRPTAGGCRRCGRAAGVGRRAAAVTGGTTRRALVEFLLFFVFRVLRPVGRSRRCGRCVGTIGPLFCGGQPRARRPGGGERGAQPTPPRPCQPDAPPAGVPPWSTAPMASRARSTDVVQRQTRGPPPPPTARPCRAAGRRAAAPLTDRRRRARCAADHRGARMTLPTWAGARARAWGGPDAAAARRRWRSVRGHRGGASVAHAPGGAGKRGGGGRGAPTVAAAWRGGHDGGYRGDGDECGVVRRPRRWGSAFGRGCLTGSAPHARRGWALRPVLPFMHGQRTRWKRHFRLILMAYCICRVACGWDSLFAGGLGPLTAAHRVIRCFLSKLPSCVASVVPG